MTGEKKIHIRSSRGGWHHAQVTILATATGTTRHWDVTWRTQHIRCCGRDLNVADGSRPPVFIHGSYGDLAGLVTQCGSCGSLHAAQFNAQLAKEES